MVDQLRGAAVPAHQVWLPPLEPALTLDGLLPAIERDPGRGLAAAGWSGTGRLQVPVGVVDRPRDQARDVLVLDFAGPGGHLAVVGAPQTGKSTLLRTLIASLALTHTPHEAQVYAIDFGGGGLAALEGLPHVGTVAGRFDPERVQRVIGELRSLVDQREQRFRSAGIDSMPAFRALGEGADVFLVIDNWPALRQEHEELEEAVLDVAARGLGYGVHLVITANRWMEVRSNLRDNVAGRLELRPNEPMDSEVDRRLAAHVPAGVPGRGLTAARLLFQAALPRVDGRPSGEGLQSALEGLVAAAGPGRRPAAGRSHRRGRAGDGRGPAGPGGRRPALPRVRRRRVGQDQLLPLLVRRRQATCLVQVAWAPPR